jgi:hypothetical protein
MAPRKPHERRLEALFEVWPPRNWGDDPLLAAHIERTWQMDIAAQQEFKGHLRKLPLLVYSTWASSSGFPMATELRRFWYEYLERFGRYGPYSLPSSFNVLEAFVRFDPSFLIFVLRPERDHLLRFSQYLDWYTASSYPEEPRSLIDIVEEGLTYSYNFVLSANEPLLAAESAKLLMTGISLIRHGDEVSMLVLAGESPPLPPAMVSDESGHHALMRGKEKLRPTEDATESTRLLEGMLDYSRILLAARFDLSSRLNDVRYLLRDRGNSYEVATDDFGMLRLSLKESGSLHAYPALAAIQAERLRQYSDLFSAAAASLFLPAFFIDQARRVVTSEFLTTMGTEQKSPKVRRLRRELGNSYFRPRSLAYCLTDLPVEPASQYRVDPPDMKFESTGFWKALDPGQVGASADGTPVVGKTWVYRTETWESSAPETFLASRANAAIPEDSREFIYVLRSPSHSADIYKIGLTTRSVATRTGFSRSLSEVSRQIIQLGLAQIEGEPLLFL